MIVIKVNAKTNNSRKWLISNSLDNNDPCMLRHTAGCSFYQGQCITNDLWVQNLRSTGI